MATYYVGSAASGGGAGTQGDPYTLAEGASNATSAGDIVYVMDDGTYSLGSSLSLSNAGAGTSPIRWLGANSSGVEDGSRPTIQATTSSITFFSISASHVEVRNIIVDANGQSGCVGFSQTANYTRVYKCKAIDCANGFTPNSANSTLLLFCEATECQTAGFDTANSALLFGCEAYDNDADGFDVGPNVNCVFCIADTNGDDGFNVSSIGGRFSNCVAYNNSGSGWNLNTNGALGTPIVNCVSYGNGVEGWEAAAVQGGAFLINCAGGNNTSGNYNVSEFPRVDSFVSLTGDPFTDAANGDFSLNNTAGAGAAMRAAGFPGAFTRGTTTGYLDIGAAQHQDPAGGGSGGGSLVNGGLVRG